MKNITNYIGLALVAALLATAPGCSVASSVPQQVQVSVSGFYDALSPYGRWMNYRGYGQVWIPDAGRGFRPYYTNGHWVYSDYGWTWVSDYDWGWAPFHYGRWLFDDAYGWIWVPGDEWGPAWVTWRNSPDYYGWAPLGPGMNININIGYNIPAAYWSFVPCRYITSPYIHRYYVDRGRNVTIINNTTVINNVTVVNNRRYYAGPPARDVERVIRDRVRPVRIVDNDRPGTVVSRNQVRMYRPEPAALRQPSGNRVISNGNRDANDRNDRFDNPARPNRVMPGAGRVQPAVPDRINDNNNNNNRVDRPTPNRVVPAPSNNTPATHPDDNRPSSRPVFTPRPAPANNPASNRPERVMPDRNRPEARPAPARPAPVERAAPPRTMPQRDFPRPQAQPQQRMQQPAPQPRPQMRQAPAPRPAAPAPQQNNGGGRSRPTRD